MMPPAAPDPTITKSTTSLGRKRAEAGRCSCMSASPVRVGVVVAEWRLEARLMFEAEHLPARVLAIAAVSRQSKHADDRVETRRLEERRLLDLPDNVVLLFRRQRRETGCSRRSPRRPSIQIGDTVAVEF